MAARPTHKNTGTSTRGRPRTRNPVSRFRRRSGTPRTRNLSLFSWKGLGSAHAVLLVCLLAAVVTLVGLMYWGKSSKPPSSPRAEAIIRDQAHSAGRPLDLGQSPRPRDTSPQRTGEIHDGDQIPPQNSRPTSETNEPKKPGRVPNSNAHATNTGTHYTALSPEYRSGHLPQSPIPPKPPSPPISPPMARVAIVIDDFGVDLDIARRFVELRVPVTLSILPHQRYSREIADFAHAHHRQVILHLPMEPRGYPKMNPGKGALLVSMSESTIQKSISAALESSPHFSGINNHMGSRFSENAVLMTTVLHEAQKRGLFYIDSYTTSRSVAPTVAQQVRIPFVRRDVFLDNTQSENAIRAQIKQVIRRAKIHGSALAIGHPHEATLRALSEEGEEFEREGIAVVPAGDLIRDSLSFHFDLDLPHLKSYEDQVQTNASLRVYT